MNTPTGALCVFLDRTWETFEDRMVVNERSSVGDVTPTYGAHQPAS